MATFLIKGGRLLEGEIEVRGSKNAALPLLAASLLFDKNPEIKNVPQIEDIFRMKELVLGVKESEKIDTEIAKKIRASILLVGPTLARFGRAVFPHPGGCVIGARPIDVFLSGWQAMGAEYAYSGKTAHGTDIHSLKAPNGLSGCDFTFRALSVTGTEGLMMTAVLAKGKTILRNAALEPEVARLAEFLNKNGAKISGAGTTTVIIEGRGVELLRAGGGAFCIPPDRIEAGTLAILGALAAKKLVIRNFPGEELVALLAVLKDVGVEYEITPPNPPVFFPSLALERPRSWIGRAVNIKTKEYPGFPTDLQAPFAVLATQASGASMIHETIFEGRLNYMEDLNKMGARIILCDPHRAIVNGPTVLHARTLESPDIRAGLALIMAALIAEGESQIGNIYQVDRGYEKIDERLRAIGADIKRI